MMKEIEEGKTLRRVVTNDRSKPILPKSKAKGKVLHGQISVTGPITGTGDQADDETTVFVYDSEKPTVANQILLDIQRGVRLKKTVCNDRSRPILDGLRTLRRQTTVDAPDTQEPTTPLLEPDEDYDDIDKVRDDLQSTKQLLEIELKNRAKSNAENCKLLEEISRLKEQLAKKVEEKPQPAASSLASSAGVSTSFGNHNTTATPYGHSATKKAAAVKKSSSRVLSSVDKSKSSSKIGQDDSSSSEEDFGELDAVEDELNALRGQAELARKTAEEFERLYKETAAKLVTTQAEMEDIEHKAVLLQKKLRRAQAPGAPEIPDITNLGMQTDPMELPPPAPDYHHARPNRSMSKRDIRRQMSRQDSHISATSAGNEELEGEDSEDEEFFDEDDEAKAQKRELAMLQSRLRSAKDKERNTRNERIALRLQLRKFRSDLKDERKKYAKLKKEVDRMALLMSEVADDEDAELVVEEVEVTDSEGEDDDTQEEANEQDEEQEDEDDDEEDDIEEVEDVESDGVDTESDEMEERLTKLSDRIRNHDNTLNTLKKGNYQLKTRVDSWQEELRKERNRYFSLEQELNTCLAELG